MVHGQREEGSRSLNHDIGHGHRSRRGFSDVDASTFVQALRGQAIEEAIRSVDRGSDRSYNGIRTAASDALIAAARMRGAAVATAAAARDSSSRRTSTPTLTTTTTLTANNARPRRLASLEGSRNEAENAVLPPLQPPSSSGIHSSLGTAPDTAATEASVHRIRYPGNHEERRRRHHEEDAGESVGERREMSW